MEQVVKDAFALRRKLIILEYARLCGSVTKACREFEVPRSSFYKWKKAFDAGDKAGLIRKKPIPLSHPRALSAEVVEKIRSIQVLIVRNRSAFVTTETEFNLPAACLFHRFRRDPHIHQGILPNWQRLEPPTHFPDCEQQQP